MEQRKQLLVVWTSQDEEVAKKMVLLYSSVILERRYWDEAHLMIWGPSAKLLAHSLELQEKILTIAATGVKLSACIVCSDDYNVTEKLTALGVECTHTGEFLTQALHSNWKVITF